MTIALLGAGVMGGTLLAALVRSGHDPADLLVSDKAADRAEEVAARQGTRAVPAAEAVAAADVVVAGPGMRGNRSTEKLAAALVDRDKPLVLDAAILHALPARRDEVNASGCPTILLPHAGEMASLLGCEEDEVEADPAAAGHRCATCYDTITLV